MMAREVYKDKHMQHVKVYVYKYSDLYIYWKHVDISSYIFT